MKITMRHDDPLYYYTGDIPTTIHYVLGRYRHTVPSPTPPPPPTYIFYHPPVLLERLGHLWQIVNAEDKYTKPPDIWIPIPTGVRIASRCTSLDISLLQHQVNTLEQELDTWQKLHRQIKIERDLLNDLISIQKERIYELENGKGTPQVTNWEPIPGLYREIPSDPIINQNKESNNA